MASAQIFIAELDIGVLTQANGRYLLLNVPAGTHTLTFQRIGYREQTATVEVTSGSSTVRDFAVTQQALQLNEVLVTGTVGGSQRRSIGNVVERVELADELARRPVTSMEQALSVAAPGISTVSAPSDPGGSTKIRLRGSASTSLSGDPVIFVDGIRINADPTAASNRYQSASRLSDIDPNDIESIEIIKGPAAATLYGTDAANGVIQIITKRGVAGEVQFDASVEMANQWVPWINTQDYWFSNPENGGEISRVNLRELEPQWTTTPYQGQELFPNAWAQDYNFSARGGSQTLRYFASFNRTDQDGTFIGAYDKRSSVRATLSLTPHESFSADLTMSVMWGDRSYGRSVDGNGPGDQLFAGAGVKETISTSLSHPRRGWRAGFPETELPTAFSQHNELRRNMFSISMTHNPVGWLSHRLIVGLDETFDRESRLRVKDSYIGACCSSVFNDGDKRVVTLTSPTWSMDYSGSLTFDPLAAVNTVTSFGLQYYNKQRLEQQSYGRGFATSPLTTVSAAGETTGGEDWLENTTLGVFVQQQIGWQDRVFVTGALRADDSSAFGDDFSWAIYPKFSATWVVHEEPFWNIDWMSQFRLRGAWGAAGQQPDLVAATRLYQPITGTGGSAAVSPLSFGNPDLGPERGEELELGFDAEFFDGRLSGTFTKYWRKTKDGILATPLAPSLGYTSSTNQDQGGSEFFANLGEVSAWGTETSLNWQALIEDPLRWDLNFSFTTMGNRIDNLGDVQSIPVPRGRDHAVGYQLASLFERKVVSAQFVSGTSGAVTNVMCDGGVEVEGKAFPMQGGDPVPCADAPEVFWGVGEPTRLASLQSTWTIFRDWQLSMLMDYKGGHWSLHEYLSVASTSYPAHMTAYLRDDPIGVAYLTQTHRNGVGMTRAGFARLREIQLGYNLPASMTNRLRADRVRIHAGMSNVATLWQAQSHVEREPILDLDSNSSNENFGGETRGTLMFRQVTLGVNVSF